MNRRHFFAALIAAPLAKLGLAKPRIIMVYPDSGRVSPEFAIITGFVGNRPIVVRTSQYATDT